MNKGIKTLLIVLGTLLVVLIVYFMTPSGRETWNNYKYKLAKVDERTDYDTLKQVEDTCRAMISTYKSDKVTYETYKDSEDKDMRNVALQAKIRANSTAISYNEYILKNSYVWKNNVPADIYMELPIIE